MKTELRMPRSAHVELFDSLEALIRSFAQLVTSGDRNAMQALDQQMKDGMVITMTLAFGSAGPLGVILHGTLPDNSTQEIMTLDAPPRDKPFQLET